MTIRIIAGLLFSACWCCCSTASGRRPTACAKSGASSRRSKSQTAENTRLGDRNRTLAAEVRDLKDGRQAIEERARTDLGMIEANETFFQVVPPARPTRSLHRSPPRRRPARGRPRPTCP